MMQKHQISSKWGGGSAGTSNHAAATRRALPHPNRYRKLKSEPIPWLGSEGCRYIRSDYGGKQHGGAHLIWRQKGRLLGFGSVNSLDDSYVESKPSFCRVATRPAQFPTCSYLGT